jgi:carboxypeptidase family protein
LLIGWPGTLRANECKFKRISAPQVCGQVLDVTGKPIENVQIVLEKNKQSPAITRTDSLGHFDLKRVEKGDYELVIRSDGWDTLRWPTRITKNAASKTCKRPIFVSLAPRTGMGCGSRITMKKPNQ